MRKFILLACLALGLSACQESLEQRATREAREFTEKKCPMPLGSDGKIVLESIEFDIPTHTWRQHYLLNMLPEAGPFDQAEARRLLLDELRNSPSYQPYMDNGFIFHYIYRRMMSPNDTLLNLKLGPADYRN